MNRRHLFSGGWPSRDQRKKNAARKKVAIMKEFDARKVHSIK